MPTTPSKAPIVVSLDTKTPEWGVVEAIRSKFVTKVTSKNGEPKFNAKGEEQVRRASATEIVEKVLATVLLNASEETLFALASEAKDKVSSTGKLPKFSTKSFIESIVASRPTGTGSVDLSKLSDEELAAELKRREEAKKVGSKN
jgi:hypothetical protein